MAGSGEFDESKHPRAPDGKFGSGGGSDGGDDGADDHDRAEASADDRAKASLKDPAFAREHGVRLQEAADAARSYHSMQHPGEHAPDTVIDSAIHAEARAIHEEADANAGAAAAEAAGHLKDLPSEVSEYEALEAGYAGTADDLHKDGQVAIGHLAELHVLADDEIEVGQDHEVDTADSVASQLDDSTGKETTVPDDTGEAVSFDDYVDEDHDGHPDSKPDREGYDDGPEGDAAFTEDSEQFSEAHKEYLDKKQKFDSMVEARRTAYNAKAVDAQDAFEALHEKQVAAIARIKAIDKARDKAMSAVDDADPSSLVNESAFAHHAKDEEFDDAFADEDVQADYERAHAASEHRLNQASTRLAETSSRDPESMVDAAKATKDLIKQLSKITGRKPKLPTKPAKPKKSYRPDGGPTASVGVMARHKLRLSKLEFISLVDTPAQETASIRLIKRAGAREQVKATATARFVKLTDGAAPLAYFWAFTCTGEDGQPYHDLQGDAIAPDAYVKAAEEFMAAGGAVDEMHDNRQAGRVAFAFPMDSDIASAMFGKSVGGAIKTSGLMVAIRPTADQLAKLRSGAYTGVSIAGLGTREVAKGMPPWMRGKDKKAKGKKPARYGKVSTPTSETEGHAHTIDLCAPAGCWGTLQTSYNTAAGSDQQHAHAWTYDPITGAVTILADSGHTHTTEGVVSAETLADAAADDDEGDAGCEPCEGEGKEGGPTVVVVSARSPERVSTHQGATATVKSQEQRMATDQEKIVELTKQVERLTALASLTDAQRGYHATLGAADGAAFLAKSAADRAVIVEPLEVAKRALQEVVYTSATSGEVFRKSDDPRLVTMAKSLDAANAATVQVTLEKRASVELSHFAKAVTVRAAIVKAVDGIADEAVRKEAHEAIKGANAALVILGKSNGANDGSEPVGDDPVAKFNAGLETFAKSTSLPIPAATVEFLKTVQGAELYAGTLARN